jgi:hypothetical protein
MKRYLLAHLPVLGILLIALLIRCYHITNPILDWHSFRQADTASVTREYVKHGINLLVPRFHDNSNIASGKENLEGYRMVEFPIINALIALVIQVAPFLSLEITSRVFSILFSLGTIVCLFYLATAISGKKVGYMTLVIASLLPYYVYYSRTILPEPYMLFFSTLSITCFYFWLTQKKLHLYFVSLISLMLALLLKPFVGFLAPVYVAIAFVIQGKKVFKNFWLYPFPILAVLPFLWWRSWIVQFPSGIPASDWLFNGNGIRFRPAWVRWLFYERLTKLILGYTGIIFYLTALYKLTKKEIVIYGSWWLGAVLYLSVIATGNVQHDYYQVLLVPIIVITFARGVVMFEQLLAKKLLPFISLGISVALVGSALFFGWSNVKGYFNVNHWEYVAAGQAADKLLPANAKVIAPAFGDTLFLYQTNRTGWPIGFEIDKKIGFGAQYYITTSYDDEARELENKYFTIQKTPEYLLLDLSKPKL